MILVFNRFFFVIVTYLYIIVVIIYGVVHSNEEFVFLIALSFSLSASPQRLDVLFKPEQILIGRWSLLLHFCCCTF